MKKIKLVELGVTVAFMALIIGLIVFPPPGVPEVLGNNNNTTTDVIITPTSGSDNGMVESKEETSPEYVKEPVKEPEQEVIYEGKYEAGRVTGETKTVNGKTWYYCKEPTYHLDGWYGYNVYSYVLAFPVQ